MREFEQMKRTILGIAGLVLLAAAVVMFTGSYPPLPDEQTSERVARSYLTHGSTFRFDGIRASLTLMAVVKLRIPYGWEFRYWFECSHSGYGDRSEQKLLQVVTPHTARVRVIHGRVVVATIDDAWDEMGQTFVNVAQSTAVIFSTLSAERSAGCPRVVLHGSGTQERMDCGIAD